MLQKITRTLNKVSGPKKCPSCKKSVIPIQQRGSDLSTCPECGYKASDLEWLGNSEGKGPLEWDDPNTIPPNCRIKKQENGDEITWAIPAIKKPDFLFFFACMWLGFMVVFTSLMLFAGGDSDTSDTSSENPWFIIPFIGLFWAVGIGMMYFSLTQMFTKHVLLSSNGLLIYGKSMFGKEKKVTLKHDEITSITQKEFYQQNYQPVYGVEIRGKGGKVKFGSILKEEEKAWLVADLKRVVHPEIAIPEQQSEGGLFFRGMAGNDSTGSTVTNGKKEDFDLTIPATKKTVNSIFGGFFLMIFGTFFGGLPYFFGIKDGSSPEPFLWIFVIIGLGVFCAGIWAIIHSILRIGEETLIKANASNVSIYKLKNGRRRLVKKVSRNEIKDARMVPLHQNQQSSQAVYNLQLITDSKAVRVVWSRPEEEVAEYLKELKERI